MTECSLSDIHSRADGVVYSERSAGSQRMLSIGDVSYACSTHLLRSPRPLARAQSSGSPCHAPSVAVGACRRVTAVVYVCGVKTFLTKPLRWLIVLHHKRVPQLIGAAQRAREAGDGARLAKVNNPKPAGCATRRYACCVHGRVLCLSLSSHLSPLTTSEPPLAPPLTARRSFVRATGTARLS